MATTKYTEIQGKEFACIVQQEDFQRMRAIMRGYLSCQLKVYGRKNNFRFWAILHDFDTEPDGTPKTKHYHVVLSFPSRHRVGAVIKMMSNIFDINENCVSVIKSTDIVRDIRYLIHLDEDGLKTPYPADDVMTNDQKFLDYAFEHQEDDFTEDELINIIGECGLSKVNVLRRIGFKKYNKYRPIINDLCRDLA